MLNTLSGILFFGAFVPYVMAIINRQTVPSPVSWLIWASVDTLTLVAMAKAKSLNGQIIGATAGAWLVTVLAVMYGNPTMGSIEWVSIVGAAAGLVMWKVTGNAVTAIVCAQAAILLGAIPTFASGYAHPELENQLAWLMWFASCICALLAVKKWDLANALQPVTFTVVEGTMVFLVVVRPMLG